MRFVLRMTRREFRASWRRLLFFFICVALGVGAIVARRSVVQHVRVALAREARTLLAADVRVQSSRPWPADLRARLDRELDRPSIRQRTEIIETATMVRPADGGAALARMVELQAIQPGFPLYGEVRLEGGEPFDHSLLRGNGALVRPEVLAQLDLDVGDRIMIGRAAFEVRGLVLSEPGRRLGFFSLGPRVLIDHADLPDTGLLSFGSRASHQVLLRVDENEVEPLTSRLREMFRNEFVSVRSYRRTEDQVGEDLQRAEDYLSLVGFVIVVLGGIGVWSVTRVFVRQKIPSIAVLKCVGARNRQILAVYVAQVVALGVIGSLLGIALAAVGLASIPAGLTFGAAELAASVTWSAALQGLGIGVLVSLLFAIVPLLEIRRVKPLLLLRDQTDAGQDAGSGRSSGFARLRSWRAVDPVSVGAGVAVVAGLIALAAWQAGSLRVGGFVSVGFVAVGVALHAAGAALVRAVRPLQRIRWFPLRHAVIGFARPGNQTRVILLAVGLGSFFIIGIRALEQNLLREFSLDLRPDGPDLFLIDIQPDQAEAMRQFLGESLPGQSARLIPVVRARVTGVRGREVNLESYADVRGRGSLAREYVMTYRPRLEENERVVAGRFWAPRPSPTPEVSIEESLRERFGIDLGDLVRFDIQGRTIEARVTSVRRVDWGDARAGGFMFLFRPGTLERAPQTYIGVTRGPADPRARARLQRDLVARFPNVSAIDVREVARTLEAALANVTLAITIVGAVALLSGVLILVGSVAMTKFQRLQEAAVFKTLGATRRTIAAMLLIEYATLGALAGLVGGIGSLVLSWAICRHLLDISWRPAPGVTLAGTAIATVLVGAVGVLASLDVLRQRPLAVLRAE